MRPRSSLPLLVVLAAIHTWPLSGSPATRSLNHNADAEQWEWTLSWIAHTLPRNPARVFDGNVFAPEPIVLAYSDPVLAPAVLAAPIQWLGGSPVLLFNVALITGLVLTAFAGWFVVWKWTGSSDAALVAGALTAFNVHLLTRLPHVQAAHSWGLPLTLYFTDRLIESPTRRDGVLLALVLAATAATSAYTLAFAGVIVAAGLVLSAALRRWRGSIALGTATALGIVMALPVLVPYLRIGAAGTSRPLEMVAQFSATPAGYLTSLSHLHAGWTARFLRDEVNVLFAGFTAVVLATIGAASASRTETGRRRVLLIGAVATVGVVLSFGPATPFYRWLYGWLMPLRGLRAAARFGFLFLVSVALLAGLGAQHLRARATSPRTARIITALIVLAITAEAWMAPIRTLQFSGVPAIYDLLPSPPARVMLVELPFYPPEGIFQGGEYMLNATAHWQPVMNGYSGYTPMSYRRRAEAFWFFPRDWAIDAIEREGATHVMVHLEKFTPSEVADIQQALRTRPDLRLIGSDANGHRLYEVTKP